MPRYVVWNEKLWMSRPVQILLRCHDLIQTKRRSMSSETALLAGSTVAEDRAHGDEGGSRGIVPGGPESPLQSLQIIPVIHLLHMPAVGLKAISHVLREGKSGPTSEGHAVVVIEHDQLAQAQMPS